MNVDEWLKLCKAVEARWGKTSRWGSARTLAQDRQVVGLEYEYARLAIDNFPGDRAPTPKGVIDAGYATQRVERRKAQGRNACDHRNWAFSDADTNEEGKRQGMCVACGTVRWFGPGQLLTASELGLEDGFADLRYQPD